MNRSIHPWILPSFTRPHTHLPTQPLIPPFSYSPVLPSFCRSIHLSILTVIHSFTCLSTSPHPPLHLPTHQPTFVFVHPPSYSPILSPIYLTTTPSFYSSLLLFLPPSLCSFLPSLFNSASSSSRPQPGLTLRTCLLAMAHSFPLLFS